jgi:hypothetical protein
MDDQAQIHELICRYLDSDCSAGELAVLDRLLSTDPSAATAFAKLAQFDSLIEAELKEQIHRDWLRQFLHGLHIADLLAEEAEEELAAAQAPKATVSECCDERPLDVDLPRIGKRNLHNYPGRRSNSSYRWTLPLSVAGFLAGVAALVLVATFNLRFPAHRPIEGNSPLVAARLTRAVDCVWSHETAAPTVGDELAAGRRVALNSGLAELVFQSGARAILEGPVTLEVRSGMGAMLHRGKVAVTVENPQARGFEIHTPGMTYTDLGTEFGVLVAQTGAQEVHVFRGRVQAEQGTERGARSGEQNSPPLILSAHEAVRIAAPDALGSPGRSIERIAADQKRFVRVIREPFPLYSTGVRLAHGEKDPHWQIVAISTDPAFKLKQALVAKVDPSYGYLAGSRATAQWIATAGTVPFMPDGCRWTLRTQFNLSGFDPATAQIEGRIAADDYVAEVRLNGVPMPLPERARAEGLPGTGAELRIDKGFVAGRNTVEIVVKNAVIKDAKGNRMAFYLEWKGTAARSEKRQ